MRFPWLSMPLLENEKTGMQFALLIFKLLAGRSSRDCVLSTKLGKGLIMTDNDPKPTCRQWLRPVQSCYAAVAMISVIIFNVSVFQ